MRAAVGGKKFLLKVSRELSGVVNHLGGKPSSRPRRSAILRPTGVVMTLHSESELRPGEDRHDRICWVHKVRLSHMGYPYPRSNGIPPLEPIHPGVWPRNFCTHTARNRTRKAGESNMGTREIQWLHVEHTHSPGQTIVGV